MARHYFKDSERKKRFWSDNDGDHERKQTVYRPVSSIFGGSSKVKGKYDPVTGKLKK